MAVFAVKGNTLFFLCGYIHEFWGSSQLVKMQFS